MMYDLCILFSTSVLFNNDCNDNIAEIKSPKAAENVTILNNIPLQSYLSYQPCTTGPRTCGRRYYRNPVLDAVNVEFLRLNPGVLADLGHSKALVRVDREQAVE